MKILAPAGNFESLKMAVFNGAHEVYLGINNFNARNNINGFSLETLKQAVDFAHLFDVKICLAINILFTNQEMQNALNIVVDAYNLGVDAFIVQDLGLAQLIYNNYPFIELHASTQMGLHNLEGVKQAVKYGFKRVVLARETPLEEIKLIKQNCDVEIEYFAQGALCVSFSGNCYLSSYLCGASGNRGKCKQLCRLPYTLQKDGKIIKTGYLLSAKDFNMIERLKDLQNAGVDVIKIEGRARRAYYVAMTTKEYSNALNKQPVNQENLKLAFNREYTQGYFSSENIISKYNNHIGIFVGKVEKVVLGKNFNQVYISSNRKLYPKSSFKFFKNSKEITTLSAYDLVEVSKGIYKLTTTQKVNVNDSVNLIVDAKSENQVLNSSLKKEIDIDIYAEQNKPIKAVVKLKNNTLEILGDICEPANKQPITKNDIQDNFLKSEIFNPNLSINKLDNVFMPKQKLNKFRRSVFAKVYSELTKAYYKNIDKIKITNNYRVINFNNFKIVENLDENFNADKIIYSPSEYKLEDVRKFVLKCKSLNKEPYLDTPNFALKHDIKLLEEIVNKTKINIIANNYYALSFDTNIVIGAGLNVYNNFTAQVFDKPVITAESNISTKIDYPLMTLRHCPLKEHLNAKCNNCPYTDGYTYKMDNGKILKLKRKKLSTCTFYLKF